MNFVRKFVRLVGMLLMLNISMAWTPAAIADTFYDSARGPTPIMQAT